MKFCKNCGHEVRDSAKICTNCGTKIEGQTGESKASQTYVIPETETVQQPAREPMDPKKKKKIIIIVSIIAALIIALFIMYKVFENMASPDSALDNISEAVSNQDAEQFQKAINTDISEEEAIAYFEYVDSEIGFSQYTEWINDQKTYLNDGLDNSDVHDGLHTLLSIERQGSKYLLFDDYQFTIPKSNVYVETNGGLDTFKYELDGETVEWKTNDSKFNELIPGKYNFEGTGIMNEEEEFNASVSVNFAENYDRVVGLLSADLFYLEFNVPVLYSYGTDIDSDDISLTMNGEPFAEDIDFETDNKAGPFKFDEEYLIEGTVAYGGKTFNMEPVTLNLNAESEKLLSDYDSMSYYMMDVNFDEDEINKRSEAVYEQEQVESERESFEENMEQNTEDLVSNYLNALEYMYLFDDIGEVEEYIAEDSAVLGILQGNLDNDNFGNMDIQRVSFSNYSKDENTIVIDAETRRLHDDIDDPVTYSTRYNIQYNPETLELKILSFSDL